MKKIIISYVLLTAIVLLSGCSTAHQMNKKDFKYRENILTKAKNYNGLIDLYRDFLKENESELIRLKLSEIYYLSGDSKSSLYYLSPLLTKPNAQIYLLQIKNFINMAEYHQAMASISILLKTSPNNAEVHNLYGIVLANTGKIPAAEKAIKKSRDFFIADETAINNLAVIAMLDSRYKESVSLLLPEYINGKKNNKLIYNLVFSLIQIGDIAYAKNIIETEKISERPENLIRALSQVDNYQKG